MVALVGATIIVNIRQAILVLDFIVFLIPFFEVENGCGFIDVDAWNEAFQVRFCDFLIDEMIAKVDSIGIVLSVGVVDAAHTCPVERTQAHGARLATAVNHAAFKVEIVHQFTSLANCVHFGVCGRVVVNSHTIAAGSQHFTVFHNHGTKRTAALIYVVACQFASHFDVFHIFWSDFNIVFYRQNSFF